MPRRMRPRPPRRAAETTASAPPAPRRAARYGAAPCRSFPAGKRGGRSKARLQTYLPPEGDALESRHIGRVVPAIDDQGHLEPHRPRQVVDVLPGDDPDAGVVQRRLAAA